MGNDPIAPLRERACMCKITATAFGSVRIDRERSTSEYKVVFNLLEGVDAIHKKLIASQVEARNALRACSLPFGDEEGWRILPYANLPVFMQGYLKAQVRYNEFYTGLIASAKEILANASKDAEMAAGVPQLLKSYSLDYAMQPFPGLAFPGLSNYHADTLVGKQTQRLGRVMERVAVDAVASVREPVARLVDRTTALSNRVMSVEMGDDVGRTGVLKERVADDFQAALRNLFAYNFDGDPRVVQLIMILEQLGDVTSRGLRESRPARDKCVSVGLRALRHIDQVVGQVLPRHA